MLRAYSLIVPPKLASFGAIVFDMATELGSIDEIRCLSTSSMRRSVDVPTIFGSNRSARGKVLRIHRREATNDFGQFLEFS